MIPVSGHHKSYQRYPLPVIIITLFIVIIGLGGCSVFSPVGDFVGQHYQNVVAYFNTYYNASTAFDEAETDVIKQQEITRAKDQPIKLGDISATAKQKFDLSIEKFSRLLSYYPTSKWVDRSLFMIGKAYYYKGDIVRGERKFRELITTMPSSDYVNPARLWLGRSLVASNRFVDARSEMVSLIPKAYENGERKIGGEAGLLLGQICLELIDTAEALSAFKTVIEQSHDDALNSEAQLSIAEILSATGEPENVLEAFVKVREFNPVIVVDYKARLRYAQYMTKINRYDEAMSELQYLLDNPKYIEYTAQIKYSLATAFHQKGDITEAYQRYIEIDTLYTRSEVAVQSYFKRALIQQKDSGNYPAAGALFEKARLEYPQSPLTQKAADYAESMKQYVQLRTRIARCDTLLEQALRKPDSTRSDSLHSDVAKSVVDTTLALEQPKAIRDSLNKKINDRVRLDTATIEGRAKRTGLSALPKDSLLAVKDTTKKNKTATLNPSKILEDRIEALYDLGSLFYLRINEPDSALNIFLEVLRDSSASADIAAGSLFTVGQIYLTPEMNRTAATDSLYDSILVKYPKSKYAQEIRRQRKLPLLRISEEEDAQELFWEAEKSLEKSDSEITFQRYKNIIDAHPKTEHAMKAWYTVGWLYENTYKNLDSAVTWYSTLAKNFPASSYATQLKGKLGEVDAMKKRQDSIAAALKQPPEEISPPVIPQKPAKTDTTKTAGKDTVSNHSVDRSKLDSVKTTVKDSLSRHTPVHRRIQEPEERVKGLRQRPLIPDTLGKPEGNFKQDTTSIVLPDSVLEKAPVPVKKESMIQESDHHREKPDSTRN